MTDRTRTRWTVPAAGLAAVILIAGLMSSSGARPQDASQDDAWLKSGNPCYPSEQNKKYIESQGGDASYIHCRPLKVEVLWEVQEVFHHHAGLGTSHANYRFCDTFPAYVEVVYKSPKSTEVSNFHIQGPAPCCPGTADAELQSLDVALIICNQSGRGCKPWASRDAMYFTMETPKDTTLGLTWDETEGAHANFQSSRVQFNTKAVPEPYREIGGLRVLDSESHSMDVRGTPGFFPDDIDRLFKDGEVQKVFTDRIDTAAPGLPVSGSQNVKATVKLIFASDWEKWRVTVVGTSKDDIRPDIKYTQKGVEQKLPIAMEFDWSLTGEFTIRNPKKNPVFDSGKLTQAQLLPHLIFQGQNLFTCSATKCSDTYDISKLPGAPLSGSVSGKTVTLTWPNYDPGQCIQCKGNKLATEKVRYWQKFTTTDFMRILSNQQLTLQNGFSLKAKPYDWMSCTITLKKIS